MEHLAQVILLLGAAVTVVVGFHRLQIPTSLGYLLVGLLLGPHTLGPVIDIPQIVTIAEFGIVFLLFTIGLNFSLPQILALRHQVLGLGTSQVVLTTGVVGSVAWLAGLPPVAAFVIGAVFAQSSTTIIGKQLMEQGEENSRHGKLGLAMSVFQDVTAVPFVVVIPVLGMAAGAEALAGAMGWALAKALLALLLVFLAGRWLLRPVFHFIAGRRSAEIFTLTVLFVALLAAWTTNSLGLSLAFGAFLAGMMLGETEFRHQVESTIRPFRDVLLGLFFIGIGMLVDPGILPQIWHWALLGALVLLISKTLLVMALVRSTGADPSTAWRTGLLLAVGGEFGFALLAIAFASDAIDFYLGQIALMSVLFSMVLGAFIIKYNQAIASVLVRGAIQTNSPGSPVLEPDTTAQLYGHVIILGYGRIGQSVAHLLGEENMPFIALDLDAVRVREAHGAGEPVYYGDASDRTMLELLGLNRARLVIISHDDVAASLKALEYLRTLRPDLPVMVRTRDETRVEELQQAGATEVVPETLEAGLMIASQALLLLDIPPSQVMRRIQEQRSSKYRLIREFFRGDDLDADDPERDDASQARSIGIPSGCSALGKQVGELDLGGAMIQAIVRSGKRWVSPPADTRVEENDVIVIYGSPEDLQRAERRMLE
ncbi:cation:proton antiporter domain-containing protein [Stutzerimonas tarimensis]|uniref:Cation:proton antiporter n=1 Tax=Stutzerimonas tarimensis TaxID=1507735 RepID=A0ABV7T3W4_9GAMM